MKKPIGFIDAYNSITKDNLFDFVVRVYMHRNFTRDEAYQKIYELSKLIKKEKRAEKLKRIKAQ